MKKKSSGAVLSLVTILAIILSLAGLALLRIGHNARIQAAYATSEIAARLAADAGLCHALSLMNQKATNEYIWDPDTLPTCSETPLPNCQAAYNFEVLGDVDDGYEVVSTGTTNSTEETVSSTLKLKGLFDYAIFAEDGINLKMGTTVVGYNYGPEDPILQLGTNSIEEAAMSMKSGVTVVGDVIIGPEGDIDFAIDSRHEAEITGDTYALPETRPLPIMPVPAYLATAPSKGSIIGGEVIISDGKYDIINIIGANNTVTIDGDVTLYILGDVSIGSSCKIEIADIVTKPDAALTLFLGGDYFQRTDAHFVNRTKDPSRLKIYGLEGCEKILFLTDSVLYASIYAPYADMELHNSIEITGSVVVKHFTQNIAADFHYDSSLSNVGIDDIGVKFVVDRWRE